MLGEGGQVMPSAREGRGKTGACVALNSYTLTLLCLEDASSAVGGL